MKAFKEVQQVAGKTVSSLREMIPVIERLGLEVEVAHQEALDAERSGQVIYYLLTMMTPQ